VSTSTNRTSQESDDTFNEDDWNLEAVDKLSKEDKADEVLAYPASLIEGERALWRKSSNAL